jgi:hypothetical protein
MVIFGLVHCIWSVTEKIVLPVESILQNAKQLQHARLSWHERFENYRPLFRIALYIDIGEDWIKRNSRRDLFRRQGALPRDAILGVLALYFNSEYMVSWCVSCQICERSRVETCVFIKNLSKQLLFLKAIGTDRLISAHCCPAFMMSHGGRTNISDEEIQSHYSSSMLKLASFSKTSSVGECAATEYRYVKHDLSCRRSDYSWNSLHMWQQVKQLKRMSLGHLLMKNCLRTCLKPPLLPQVQEHLITGSSGKN